MSHWSRPSRAASITCACSTSTRSTSATRPRMKLNFWSRCRRTLLTPSLTPSRLASRSCSSFCRETRPLRCSWRRPKLLGRGWRSACRGGRHRSRRSSSCACWSAMFSSTPSSFCCSSPRCGFERSISSTTIRRRSAMRALLAGDVAALDVDRADRVVRLRELAHQVEHRRLVLLDLAVEVVELQAARRETPAGVLRSACDARSVLRCSRARLAVSCSSAVGGDRGLLFERCPVALELLDLVGDLLQLLLGVVLPLLGRLHRRLGLHEFVFGRAGGSAMSRRALALLGQFVLRLGQITGGIVEPELRVFPLLVQLDRLRAVGVVFLEGVRQPQIVEAADVFLVVPRLAGLRPSRCAAAFRLLRRCRSRGAGSGRPFRACAGLLSCAA